MELFLAFVTATAVLVAIPGPNVALIVANTLKDGFRLGAVTVLGTTIGVGIQLALVVAGLAAVLSVAASAMLWIKWLGVAYLIYLGVQTWREPPADITDVQPVSRRASLVLWQGIGMALINPKTLLFNAAFLPQFLEPGAGPGHLMFLAAVYLAIFTVGDFMWAGGASRARLLIVRFSNMRNRLTAAIFITSGIGLALARIDK